MWYIESFLANIICKKDSESGIEEFISLEDVSYEEISKVLGVYTGQLRTRFVSINSDDLIFLSIIEDVEIIDDNGKYNILNPQCFYDIKDRYGFIWGESFKYTFSVKKLTYFKDLILENNKQFAYFKHQEYNKLIRVTLVDNWKLKYTKLKVLK